MAIAQVVVDLPIEGVFDYTIPDVMRDSLRVGSRVRVSFNADLITAYVIDIFADSSVAATKSIKPIKRLIDPNPIFDESDLTLAQQFADYYGVNLGEALASLLREAKQRPLFPLNNTKGNLTLYEVIDGDYVKAIASILAKSTDERVLVLVPDVFYYNQVVAIKQQFPKINIITRSQMHHARNAHRVIMIEDDNASYQQEQTPKYHARQLLLMMRDCYHCAVDIVSVAPSVEIKAMEQQGLAKTYAIDSKPMLKPVVVDMTIYQQKGLLSPPALMAIDRAVKGQGRALIVLNRLGNYAVTKCSDCGHVLTCPRCAVVLNDDKKLKQFVCRTCHYAIEHRDNKCPACGKTNIKSVGVGVEQFKAQMLKLFKEATVSVYQHADKEPSLPTGNLVIATVAALNLRGRLRFDVIVYLDIDRELNRLDAASSFKAWAMLNQLRLLGNCLYVQTRNPEQMMLKALAKDDRALFYQEEMNIRRELGFSPFAHWLKVSMRSKDDALVGLYANRFYESLSQALGEGYVVHTPAPEAVAKKRDQYYHACLVQAHEVVPAIKCIKQVLQQQRSSKVLTTIQVD